MTHRPLSFALIVVALSLSCGAPPVTPLPDGGSAGAGGTGGSAAAAGGGAAGAGGGGQAGGTGGGRPADEAKGLYINASLGLRLVQSPIANGSVPEGAVSGTVFVSQGEHGDAVPAKLTLNGVEVPQQTAFGLFLGYDFAKANLSSIKPGEPLTVHAELDGGSSTLTVACPPEVLITAPAEGTQASTGDLVTVQWSGSVDHQTPFKPDILVFGFNPATGAHVRTDLADRIVSGKTSDTFALPDPKGQPQWSVELHVTGDLAQNPAGVGWCGLVRRVHLVAQ
ncbi:MAG: hypothetical protein IPJ65_08050 [Archangiaceae bacterium]|nr:hypothetical protein [Archangiaceae bacterium]